MEGEFDAWIALEVEGEVVKVRCHAGFVGVQCGGWMVVTSHDEEERESWLIRLVGMRCGLQDTILCRSIDRSMDGRRWLIESVS